MTREGDTERFSPDFVQEMESERDLMSDALPAEVPLEDGLPVAADARQRVPKIAIVHEIHRQDCVALRSQEASIQE